jgi:hypothetical protein
MSDLLKMDYTTGYLQYSGNVVAMPSAISRGDVKLWFSKLKEIAEKNPDGFTVDLLSLEPIPNKGYVVAFTNETLDYWEYRTHIERWWLVAGEETKKYLVEHPYSKAPLITIGGWRNPEDGKYYVDMGLVVFNKEYAIELGKKYRQKAIFNLDNFETINL